MFSCLSKEMWNSPLSFHIKYSGTGLLSCWDISSTRKVVFFFFFETVGQENKLNSFTFTTCFVCTYKSQIQWKNDVQTNFFSELYAQNPLHDTLQAMKNLKPRHYFFVPVLILSEHPYIPVFWNKKTYLLQHTSVLNEKEQFSLS